MKARSYALSIYMAHTLNLNAFDINIEAVVVEEIVAVGEIVINAVMTDVQEIQVIDAVIGAEKMITMLNLQDIREDLDQDQDQDHHADGVQVLIHRQVQDQEGAADIVADRHQIQFRPNISNRNI